MQTPPVWEFMSNLHQLMDAIGSGHPLSASEAADVHSLIALAPELSRFKGRYIHQLEQILVDLERYLNLAHSPIESLPEEILIEVFVRDRHRPYRIQYG